jgi:hypothetical protein
VTAIPTQKSVFADAAYQLVHIGQAPAFLIESLLVAEKFGEQGRVKRIQHAFNRIVYDVPFYLRPFTFIPMKI